MHDLLWAPQFCNDYSLILEFLPRVLAKEKWYTHFDWYLETPLKKSFSALIKLVRFQEYGYFILITSLLGAVTAGGILSDRLLAILLANGLVVGFAHMVNDIEDAAEDVFSLKNSLRNPISSGLILPKTARLTAAIVGLIAVALFALMGRWPWIFGAGNLVLGLIYSHKAIRLKALPLVAFISRGALLAGLPFLSSYFTFSDSLNRIWYWPFLWLISLSLLFDLHSERSGEERTRFSRWNEISVQHGERFANVLMIGVIIVVASTGVVSMFLINLFPSWVIIIILMLLTLLIVPPYFKYRRDRTGVDLADLLFHGLVHAFAIGLMLQFLLPALVRIIRPGCF